MGVTTGALLALALQQGFTTPPGGDTTGYWQQRVAYRIVAHLDEAAQKIQASGTLRYVNNSPDTLRELYVHQYLNAFRPHSLWSRVDERAGRVRFQHLEDPHYGYERFTAPPRVNGVATTVAYPGAPDSTVARIALPAPLAPGDSLEVDFTWEARPSTLPRRQGRRGRHWDLAQWYPRIAVYDRGGWQHNALQPAGEFYGEFGDYDVTLVLPGDQVVAATGVPVSGDPGWERARRGGSVHLNAHAYGPVRTVEIAGGDAHLGGRNKRVRFLARDVHHFAWSASPDYRYEGGMYVRMAPPGRVRAWDSVAVHVLYQPGDDSTWGGGRVLQRTVNALAWLESILGRYAYPQMTVLHRIEGGGTEFPMLQMNGSPSQGLILHEGGHVWLHGILANNEWRNGWLDEGFTSYQTEWAQGLTPQERLRAGLRDRFIAPTGYRARAITPRMSRFDAIGLQMAMMDIEGEAEPIGRVAHEFRDFSTYNQMIYTRAQVMYGQLRDALGDSAWIAMLHDYYERWALKHVDELALRGAAERASGEDLRWFFDQWVRRTGLMDYALTDVRQERAGASWVTVATVARRGAYRHPISVGVRTASGWTTARIDPLLDEQQVRIATPEAPLDVRLDPHHFSWDWDRRNDGLGASPRANLDWPFLRQADRDRSVLLVRPLLWYSEPGGATPSLDLRSSYLDVVDRRQAGVAYAARADLDAATSLQGWVAAENLYLPFRERPLMGWSASAAKLDDVVRIRVQRETDARSGRATRRSRYALTFADDVGSRLLPEQWSPGGSMDSELESASQVALGRGSLFAEASVVAGTGAASWYGKYAVGAGALFRPQSRLRLGIRAFTGMYRGDSVGQRLLHLSSRDAMSTFDNHWFRPRGAVLKQPGIGYLPLGGAALRGYHWSLTSSDVAAINADVMARIADVRPELQLRAHAFYDLGNPSASGTRARWLRDAGVGLSLRGRLHDRDLFVRLDAPFFVTDPALAVDQGRAGRSRIAPRWLLTFTDVWPD